MKSAIVTGATSFIGSNLVNELIKQDYTIIAVVRPNSKKIHMLPKNDKIEIVYVDLYDIETLVETIGNRIIDVFYHFEWEGVRAPYRDNHYLQEKNYESAVQAINVAIKLKCRKFIGAGSQAEYGKCIGKIDETYKANPITEYGKAKLKSYIELNKIAKSNNIDFIWARIFSVYGKQDYEETLIMSSISKMLKDEDVDLTECTQNWDYIYVEDVAKALYLLGNKEDCENGIYNIASGNIKPLKEFVIDIKTIINSASKLNFGKIPYGSEGKVNFEPVVNKLKKDIDWNCLTDFQIGINKIVVYLKQKEKLI